MFMTTSDIFEDEVAVSTVYHWETLHLNQQAIGHIFAHTMIALVLSHEVIGRV